MLQEKMTAIQVKQKENTGLRVETAEWKKNGNKAGDLIRRIQRREAKILR